MIVTSMNSPFLIVAVSGVMLISSAHDSKPAAEISKSLSFPLFVISVFTINSSPTCVVDSRLGFTVGVGALHDSISFL